MRTKIFTFIVGLIVISLIGCTRAAKDEAKLNLSIASSVDGNGTLAATMVLSHVSINVTGAGIAAPIVYTWDNCRDCDVPPAAPSSFQLTVPSGTGRLVQILAVYEDPDTSQMNFYYGDVTKDLTTAEDTTAINVASVGSGTITDGRVAGRYFTTTTGGPTGLVDIKYNPGSGKPSLIVQNGVIINGWFSLFMLSGANLKYEVRGTGEVLWGQEMSLDSAAMDPSENSGAYFNQRVKAYLPVRVEAREENGVTNYHVQAPATHVWGYWGPGATGKRVCTSGVDSSPTPQRLKLYTTSPGTSSALAVNHYINWNLTPPTKAQLLDTTTPYGYVTFQGGVSMSSGCDTFADTFANQYSNFLKVTLDQVDGNGGDSVAGFTGIFRNTSTHMFANVSGDPKVIAGSILPGVEEVFDGLRLFKRVSNDEMRLEVPICSQLGALGFVAASSTDATLSSSGTFSLTSNITSTEGTSGVSAVVCPVKSGALATLGIFMSKWNFNMGGGGTSSPATKLALITPQNTVGSGTVANNTCTPITIEARTASNTPAYLPGMVNLTMASSDGNTTFYDDYYCTVSTSLSMFSQSRNVYMKRASSGSSSGTITVTPDSGLTGDSSNISFVDTPGTITPKIKVNTPSSIYAYECNRFSLESWHDSLFLVDFYNYYSSQSFYFTLPTASGLQFYSNKDCTGSPGVSPALSTNTRSEASYIYTGNSSSLNLQPTAITPASPLLTSDIVGGNSVTVMQPGTASNLDFMVPTYFEEGQCQTINVRSIDSNGRVSPTTAAMTVNLSSTLSGSFYDTGSCTAPVTSFNYPASTTMTNVYFKASAMGSGTLTASVTSPAISVTRSATVSAATFNQILIALPGETLTGGAITGTPTTLLQGVSSNFTIYLVKYDGQVDTTANGYLVQNGSITNATMSSFGSIYFTNGVATSTLTPTTAGMPVSLSINIGMFYGYSNSANVNP